jgi:hypothetical protein
MSQHAGLTAERWRSFDRGAQVLMIANEMNRGSSRLRANDRDGVRRCHERVLSLVDLTIATTTQRSFVREMLRWRDLVAAMFVSPDVAAPDQAAAMRALLQLSPKAASQLRHLQHPT